MKTVVIHAQATVQFRKTISVPDDEFDVFISGTDEDILCNVDFEDHVEVDDWELNDVSFK